MIRNQGGSGGGIKLDSIAVITPPAKTIYLDGDSFDPTGMVVRATYSNGATQNINNSLLRITPDPLTTVTAAATISYTEQGVTKTTTKAITVKGVFGAEWDGTSTTAWTRTGSAANFIDPVPYVAGATTYGSPFDTISPWKDMTVVEDAEAGTLVKIPKFYYKLTQTGAKLKVEISEEQISGFSVCPACMDRGDGAGERDFVYIGRYHCATSTYKSATGVKPQANVTRANFRTNIHNLGSTIWQADWAMRFTLFLLYIVEFADWNSQAKIGRGCGNNSATGNMGYTDSMPYHTGTTQSNRETYGLGTQYRNIEGLWDNVWDYVDGCYCSANYSYGLMIILNPSSFSDSSGGVSIGMQSSGYPSAFSVKNVSGTFMLFIPTDASGSDSTYSCDFWVYYAANPCLCAGGSYSQSLARGLFFFGCTTASDISAYHGSRLMKLP